MNHQLEVIDEKDKTIADLQEKLDYMIRQKFASSSEKFPSNQPSLFLNDTDIVIKKMNISHLLVRNEVIRKLLQSHFLVLE